MSEGTSVGIISLDLIVKDMVTSQVKAIADKAKVAATKPFEQAGEKIGKSVTEGISEGFSAEEIKKSLDDALKRMVEREEARFKNEGITIPMTANPIATKAPMQQYDSKAIQQQIDDFAAKTNKAADVDMSRAFTAAQNPVDLLKQKLANLEEQMEQARRKSAEIDMSFDAIGEDGSAELNKVSAAAAQAEARIISLQQQIDATQAKIDAPGKKAREAAEKAAVAAEKAAAKQTRTAEKVAAAEQRAAEKAANAKIRAELRAEKARQSAAKRQKAQTAATARTQASSFLSAAASTSKGIAKVGVMGRTAIASLRGLKTAIPFAILLTGFKLLQKAISTASSTNEQFKNSLNSVKANLQIAFTPIYQAILPMLNKLMAGLASATKYIATFISALFGKTYEQSLDATKSLQKTTAAADKAKKSLSMAGFDEINVISQTTSSAESNGSDVDYSGINSGGNAAAEEMAGKFKSAFKNIGTWFSSYVFEPINRNLSKFSKPIGKFKSLFQGVGEKCKKWMAPLSAWFATEFPAAIGSSIDAATSILAGLMDSLANIAGTVFDAFSPIIDWFVNYGLPILSGCWAEISSTASTAFGVLKTAFDTLWEGVIKPVCMLISGVIVDLMNTFKELWETYGAQTFENIRTSLESIKNTFLNIWNSYIYPVFSEIMRVLKELWDNHLKPLLKKIGEFILTLVNGAMEIYNKVIAPIVDWVVKYLYPPIAKIIGVLVDGVGKAVGNIIDFIGNIFDILRGIVDFIVGVFTGDWSRAWNGVKSIFEGIWNGLVSIAKAPINAIIGLMNGVISAINWVIDGINSISFDMPDWLGGAHIGFNIGRIGSIPYLASGGIATQPTLAMIGEYAGAKNNPEVVAPLDKLQSMLGAATDSRIIELLQTIIDLLRKGQMILVDGKVLFQLIQQEQDRQGRRYVTAGI